MISIIQESKNTWIFISFIFTLVSSLLFLVLGYIYWPPEFNFNWIVGCICTFGMAFGCYIFSLQLRNPNPYYFSVDEEVIVIHDWGKFKR